MNFKQFAFACTTPLIFSATVFAQTPTPTAAATATATPAATTTPTACVSLESCIDTSVPAAVNSCATANTACVVKSTDKFAVTSQEIADRALALKKCSTKHKRFECDVCYESSKAPLFNRFDVKLFHGLLAQAGKDIEIERKATCSSLPVR